MFPLTSASDARTVAQAACIEHQILDYVKSALRVTLAWRAPSVGLPRKMSSVQFTAKSFVRHLRRMMELEEHDGYMSIVLEEKPHLEHRVTRLQRQHEQLRSDLAELEPQLAGLTGLPNEEFEDICRRIFSVLDQVDQHDVDEIELLQDSLLCDEGGEG
jgi:hypothetical protein